MSVDINPVAAALAGLNAILNGREDVLKPIQADLYSALPDQTFDYIVANPPLLPFIEDVAYPFVGHGGADGLRITKAILDGLPSRLSAEGTSHIIGTCLSDGIRPLWSDELAEWARTHRMAITMSVTAHLPLSPGTHMFDGLVASAAVAAAADAHTLARRYSEHLSERGASHLCMFFLHAAHGSGTYDLVDVSGFGSGMWYA